MVRQIMFGGVLASLVLILLATKSVASAADAQQQRSAYPKNYQDPCYRRDDCYRVIVGSKQVQVKQLPNYIARWTQKVFKNGRWVFSDASFEESLTRKHDGNLIHFQTISGPKGVKNKGTRLLDHISLQILELILEFENVPAAQPTKVQYDLTGNDFVADIFFADGKK